MAVTIIASTTGGAPSMTGVAGSLISVLDFCLVTTLGWTKPFTGTNLASYRQPTGTSNGMYLAVDDTGGRSARVRGFEAMTAVTTGTGPFPTDAQVSGGLFVHKSVTADATARPWYFISDGKHFHFHIVNDGTTPFGTVSGTMWSFGDFVSYKPGDTFNTMIVADTTTLATGSSTIYTTISAGVSSPLSGHYVARAHTQLGGSTQVNRFGDAAEIQTTNLGNSTALTFPSVIDGGIHLSRLWVGEAAGRRGRYPGAWCPMHAVASMNSGDTFTGSGDLTGRTFINIRFASTFSVILETSDTWST